HTQIAVVGQLLDRLFGYRGGLRPLLGLAIAVNNLLVTANRVLIAQSEHFPERLDRLLSVALFTIDNASPLQKYGPLITVSVRVQPRSGHRSSSFAPIPGLRRDCRGRAQ